MLKVSSFHMDSFVRGLFFYCFIQAGFLFMPEDLFAQSAGPVKDPFAVPRTYIDTHNHLVGRFGPPVRQSMDYDSCVSVSRGTMDKLGIRKMFIMPPPFLCSHPQSYDYKDFWETVRTYSDRFAFLGGGGSLNIMIQEAVYDGKVTSEMRSKFKQTAENLLSSGALGFGEMAAEHFSLASNHPYITAPPDHELFLLLADIAAEHDVPIDIHMEAIPQKMDLPAKLISSLNPKVLQPNIAAFERFLAHNRKAKIIWAHAGWDNTGFRTASLMGELLKKHPNLYMSIKIGEDCLSSENCPLVRGQGIKPEWLKLITEFSDRFVIGSDQFYLSPKIRNINFPRHAEPVRAFLGFLPDETAEKIGLKNPERLFKIK